jgi:hypothetical protein
MHTSSDATAIADALDHQDDIHLTSSASEVDSQAGSVVNTPIQQSINR